MSALAPQSVLLNARHAAANFARLVGNLRAHLVP